MVPRIGWHEETFGITFRQFSLIDEPRVILAGMSYEHRRGTTRRVRMASFFATGGLEVAERPRNPPGFVDAWATDVL